MQVPLSKNIVISLVTGLMFGLSVTLFTFHLTCSTNSLGLYSQRSQYNKQNRNEDLEVGEQVRVLCWIMTQPETHKTKVNKVWKYVGYTNSVFSRTGFTIRNIPAHF